jgi:hypothetical protein
MAAVLGCGEGALLSHRSAAALHGLGFGAAPKIDVTVPGRSRHGQTGIVVHLVRSLHDEDRTACEHVPVTSVPRTLLDLAEVVVPRQLRRAFEEAERLDLLDLAAISRLVRRSSGRHGLKHVRAILSDAYGPVPETHSELERRFVRLCREAGIPPPATNVVVAGYTVDAYWPDHRVVAELDGFAFHHTRHAFERDRARDAELQLAGYRVLRITARRLERDSAGVARALLSLLV